MATQIFSLLSTTPGFSWGLHKRPRFKTQIQSPSSGKETRVARWSYPVWDFELKWEFLRDNRDIAANAMPASPAHELRTFMGFFLQRRGAYDPFFITDPNDNGLADQQIGVGNGSATDFQGVRSLGGFVEPVGGIEAACEVKVNGNPVTATRNVPYDGWVRCAVAPGAAATVALNGVFYFKVRFPDELDFENFMHNLWTLQRCPLVSVKSWETLG